MKLEPGVVKKANAAELRKMLRDLGEDPMGAKYGKGNVDKMRAALLAKAGKPAGKAPPPPKAPPKPPAKKPPTTPAPVDAEEAVAAAEAAHEAAEEAIAEAAGEEGATTAPDAMTQEWMRNVETRLGALEQALSMSNGSAMPPPPDIYEPIKQFMVEVGNETKLRISDAEVETLDLAQLQALAKLIENSGFALPRPITKMQVRELRLMVQELLASIANLRETVEAPAEEAPAEEAAGEETEETVEEETSAEEESAGEVDPACFEPGAVIKVVVDGETYEPCVVQEQILSEDGTQILSLRAWYAGDFGEFDASAVVGTSDAPLEGYPS